MRNPRCNQHTAENLLPHVNCKRGKDNKIRFLHFSESSRFIGIGCFAAFANHYQPFFTQLHRFEGIVFEFTTPRHFSSLAFDETTKNMENST
jgi:hypothetical protein